MDRLGSTDQTIGDKLKSAKMLLLAAFIVSALSLVVPVIDGFFRQPLKEPIRMIKTFDLSRIPIKKRYHTYQMHPQGIDLRYSPVLPLRFSEPSGQRESTQ
jgi:hypothetical protein